MGRGEAEYPKAMKQRGKHNRQSVSKTGGAVTQYHHFPRGDLCATDGQGDEKKN